MRKGKLNKHFERDFINQQKISNLHDEFSKFNLASEALSANIYVNAQIMLLMSLGWKGGPRHIIHSLPQKHNREIDLLDSLDSLSDLGYISHEMEIKLRDVDDRLMPCIYETDQDEILVLLSKSEGKITAFDPKTKQITYLENKDKREGRAYFFQEVNKDKLEEQDQDNKISGVSWFSLIFARFRPIMKKVVMASIFINIFALAMPLFIMSVYDWVIGTGSIYTIFLLLIGIIVALSAEAYLRMLRLKSLVWVGLRLDNIVSNAIYERLLFMPAYATESASISAQVSRLRSFEAIRNFFVGPLFAIVIEIPFTVILLIAIWLISGPLFLIPLVVAAIFILLVAILYSKYVANIKESSLAGRARQQHEIETFIKINSLHNNGIARNWWLQYKDKLANSVTSKFQVSFTSALVENFANAIVMMSAVAVLTFGVHLVWDGSITIGALVATMLLIWRILGPMQILCSSVPRFVQLRESIHQINRLMELDLEKYPFMPRQQMKEIEGHLSLNNLGLRYSRDTEPLLFGLNLEVEAGEIVGITGINGSGKSSLLKIISGLYQPQTGVVNIDGINIKQMDPIELRNHIAYMPQFPNFFEGSIRENLTIVNPMADDKILNNALKNSDAFEDIDNLPNGLNTMIGGNYPLLSNELMYKLNFARLLIKDSKIILIDELPNYLMNENLGKLYTKAMDEFKKQKRTVVFVSQRRQFLQIADKIIALRISKQPVIMKSNDFFNRHNKN